VRALLLEAPSRVSVADLPVPVPGPDEVLVEVRACGICGSDVHGYDGTSGRRTPPLVMGHEAAGVVVEAGPDAGPWQPGDRVALDSTLTCGTCDSCRSGATNLCERRRVLGAAFGEVRADGAFAELVRVPGRALARIPEGLPFERAALAEPLAVAIHAVTLAQAGPSDDVVVVGTGVIGLLAVQVLRAWGVRRVVGVDVDAGRLELARRLGADETLLAGSAELGTGLGADAAIEAVGTAAAIRTAVSAVRRGGRVVLVGNLAPSVEIPLQAVVSGEITLAGSCAFAGELGEALDLLAAGTVDVAPLVSAVVPLEDGPAWLDRLHAGDPGVLKVLLTP
jgi:L-iditol 2-dehydrogenase